VPVPCQRDVAIHEAALKRYANRMADQAMGGVAIWAHAGRGLRLTDADLERVITAWRSELPAESIVIAAAGSPPTMRQSDQVIARAQSMARQAADHGAAAILVHPPASFRDHSHHDELVLEYHARIVEIGLPLPLFYLYEAAGGISYPPTCSPNSSPAPRC
jgi:4-hydroxy-tetrahydrodipicolinate synthase